MSTYTPDVWVVLEFTKTSLPTPIYKVFAGWYGGFAGSNSWQLNSGIIRTRRENDWIEFDGASGSVYSCHPNNYGMSSLMHDVYESWQQKSRKQTDIKIRILTLDEVLET